MSNTLIDAIYANVSVAQNTRYSLNRKADALYAIGLNDLAEHLENIGQDVVASAKAVSHAFSGDLDDRLRDSQAMTGSLLLATLKGCFVPPIAADDAGEAV